MTEHEGFDGIGNNFPRNQRITHPQGPHGGSIGYSNRVKYQPCQLFFLGGSFDMCSKVIQMHVAGITFVAATCDAYKRLLHFFVRHASGVQHRHSCRMLGVVTDFPAVFFEWILGHGT